MRLKVNYVIDVNKEMRRVVNWKQHKPGVADLVGVAAAYQQSGTSLMLKSYAEWCTAGKP
jgi:hypothetical protein